MTIISFPEKPVIRADIESHEGFFTLAEMWYWAINKDNTITGWGAVRHFLYGALMFCDNELFEDVSLLHDIAVRRHQEKMDEYVIGFAEEHENK